MGLYPDQTVGNLPEALSLAGDLAKEYPEEQVFVGLKNNPDPWLTVTAVNDGIHIEDYQKEEEAQ